MYNFVEIEKLLEKGFTPEQIMSLSAAKGVENTGNETEKEASDSKTEVESKSDTPAWAKSLNDSITSLQRTMQAAALANTSINQPMGVEEAAADALKALIIDPPKKGE